LLRVTGVSPTLGRMPCNKSCVDLCRSTAASSATDVRRWKPKHLVRQLAPMIADPEQSGVLDADWLPAASPDTGSVFRRLCGASHPHEGPLRGAWSKRRRPAAGSCISAGAIIRATQQRQRHPSASADPRAGQAQLRRAGPIHQRASAGRRHPPDVRRISLLSSAPRSLLTSTLNPSPRLAADRITPSEL
jgi:hypothetical protein